MHTNINNLPHTQTSVVFQCRATGRICTDQCSTGRDFFFFPFYTIPFIQLKSLAQPKLRTLVGFEVFQINTSNNTEIKIFNCMCFVCLEKRQLNISNYSGFKTNQLGETNLHTASDYLNALFHLLKGLLKISAKPKLEQCQKVYGSYIRTIVNRWN